MIYTPPPQSLLESGFARFGAGVESVCFCYKFSHRIQPLFLTDNFCFGLKNNIWQ
jgi:hypothetical protein